MFVVGVSECKSGSGNNVCDVAALYHGVPQAAARRVGGGGRRLVQLVGLRRGGARVGGRGRGRGRRAVAAAPGGRRRGRRAGAGAAPAPRAAGRPPAQR